MVEHHTETHPLQKGRRQPRCVTHASAVVYRSYYFCQCCPGPTQLALAQGKQGGLLLAVLKRPT
jgi:hypothetical protein